MLTCVVAGDVANRLAGNGDLSVSATRRGYDMACRHGDPGLIGLARWIWAIRLVEFGARGRASRVLTAGIDELGPSARLGDKDTLPAEMLGMTHLVQAQRAARDKQNDDAHAHLAEAERIAVRIGERNGLRMHFGPTNVAVWRLGVGIEMGEGGRAYELATRTPLDVAALNSQERSAALYFDLSRVLVQDGVHRDAEAIRHLDTADRLAPVRIRNDPIARDLVITLDRRARRQVWELDSLRNRFGIGGQGPRGVDNQGRSSSHYLLGERSKAATWGYGSARPRWGEDAAAAPAVHQAGTGERKMGKDDETDKDKDRGRPGKHDPEREGHVHEDTAKRIDPRKYEPPPDADE